MRRNIVRLKINNKDIMKIFCSGERDYIFSFPSIDTKETYCEFHSTFHTKNNRRTLKITNFGDGEKNFGEFLQKAKEAGYHVTRDIDLLKGKDEIIDEANLINNLNKLFVFGYFETKDNFLEDSFGKSKTRDTKFPKVIRLNIPDGKNKVFFKVFVSKNIIENPINIARVNDLEFDEVFIIHDSIDEDFFVFTILVNYLFKKPKNKNQKPPQRYSK